ncbi:MAG: hypothetical protein ABSD27_07785 [Bryobacteraceae bacterium]|jgi:hypothetical protein
MRDEPSVERIEDATPEIQAAMRFCRAVFWHRGGSGSAIIHVPDPKLGHRKYLNVPVSRDTLERIRARLDRGEPCDDLGDLISLTPASRRRTSSSRKRYSPKSSF